MPGGECTEDEEDDVCCSCMPSLDPKCAKLEIYSTTADCTTNASPDFPEEYYFIILFKSHFDV